MVMNPEKAHDLPPKILLVDDELVIRRVLSYELRAENFSVTAVASGSEAISALRDTFYDLVITDLVLEGVDGVDILKATRRIAPLTAVIIITGDDGSKPAREAIRLGVDDILVKPFEVEELIFSIITCLNKRHLH